MDENYYEINGTMRVPTGGHLSSALDGSNYGSVLSDENNQLMGQARFIPDDDEDEEEDEYEYLPDGEESSEGISDKALIGIAVGAVAVATGAFLYRKLHNRREAKRLEEVSGTEVQQDDVAIAEAVPAPSVSQTELTDEQQLELALLFLDLADAQRRLNNLTAQGMSAQDVKAHIQAMWSRLADCDPKELADRVNRVIEQQHPETRNLAMLLGRQPTADAVFQPVTMRDVELALNTEPSAERDRRPR